MNAYRRRRRRGRKNFVITWRMFHNLLLEMLFSEYSIHQSASEEDFPPSQPEREIILLFSP